MKPLQNGQYHVVIRCIDLGTDAFYDLLHPNGVSSDTPQSAILRVIAKPQHFRLRTYRRVAIQCTFFFCGALQPEGKDHEDAWNAAPDA